MPENDVLNIDYEEYNEEYNIVVFCERETGKKYRVIGSGRVLRVDSVPVPCIISKIELKCIDNKGVERRFFCNEGFLTIETLSCKIKPDYLVDINPVNKNYYG